MRSRKSLAPVLGGCLLALAVSGLTGCSGGGTAGTDTLTWFINPDGGGSSPAGTRSTSWKAQRRRCASLPGMLNSTKNPRPSVQNSTDCARSCAETVTNIGMP